MNTPPSERVISGSLPKVGMCVKPGHISALLIVRLGPDSEIGDEAIKSAGGATQRSPGRSAAKPWGVGNVQNEP